MKKFVQEFKEFALRGNVLDMAVGIVIGGAFTAIVNSVVADILMPLVGIITGGINLAGLNVNVDGAVLTYGNFLQVIVQFLLIALVLFLCIKGISKMRKKKEEEPAAPAEPSEDIQLLREIRDELKKK